MKKIHILQFMLLLAVLLLISACATEDNANKQEIKQPDTKGLTAFASADNADTQSRTTGSYNKGINFYWTEGDRLWVKNPASTPTLQQDAVNNISTELTASPIIGGVQRAEKAKFWFSGTFTDNSYHVRYTGKGNTLADKVTINAQQTQLVPNDASHIGEDGDCGIATAQKVGDRYHFDLEHKAAYLTFMPYNSPTGITYSAIISLKKIKVTADKVIAGIFDFDDNGLDYSDAKRPATGSKSIELSLSGFILPATADATTANAVTMVMAPGTYSTFSIEYTVRDPVNRVFTVTKNYTNITFHAGKNKPINSDLMVFDDLRYYWDAKEEYHFGHRLADGSVIIGGNDYPKSKATDPDRWYNEAMGYNDPTDNAPAVVVVTHTATQCPNINELMWYYDKGDAQWDNSLQWVCMGQVHTGGMWFKKQSTIVRDEPTVSSIDDLKKRAPDGNDYTKSTVVQPLWGPQKLVPQGRPANTDDYFWLPRLGYYNGDNLENIDGYGDYYSCTPYPGTTTRCYALGFTSGNLLIFPAGRSSGFCVWKSQ